MRHTRVMVRGIAGVVVIFVALGATGCETARGHVEAGRLEQGCAMVERAPSPLIDDDGPALAARIRRRLEGSIRVRVVPGAELQGLAGEVKVAARPAFVEVDVVGDGVLQLRDVTLIDTDGTRLSPPRATEAEVLALVGAPAPPPPTVHTSTHTPGPFESLMKAVGLVAIGLPLSLATFGIIPPDLGGALSPTATTTSTWTTDHPGLQAWQERPEVQAAARIGHFLGVASAPCVTGRCRQTHAVASADTWRKAELALVLGVGDCAIDDVVTVDLGVAVPFKDSAADDGQWGRFWDEGLGLRPVVEDVGEALDACAGCGAVCLGC